MSKSNTMLRNKWLLKREKQDGVSEVQGAGGWVRILNRVVIGGLTEKVTFEQSPRVGEGIKSFQVEEAAGAKNLKRSMSDVWEDSREAGSPGHGGREVTGVRRAYGVPCRPVRRE